MNRRLAALSSCFLLFSVAAAGCGHTAGAAHQSNGTPRSRDATFTAAPSATPVPPAAPPPTAVTATATVAARPKPTATAGSRPTAVPPALPVHLLYAELRPDTVQPGGALTARVQTSGTVRRVTMTIASGDPRASGPSTFTLANGSPGVWSGTVTAPAVPGVYVFTVSVIDGSGARKLFTLDGWTVTVTVTGPAGSRPAPSPTPGHEAASQPLPDDIPLAPAYAWSNPSPATFTALGGSIRGWEVSTDARPDIAPSAVADFYRNRFPRSGWSVVAQPQVASSFSMVATNGARICLVQYAASSVHLFYGTR